MPLVPSVLIEDILPPSRETWMLLVKYWQWFPVVTGVQWTSINSRLNMPGRYAWVLMEIPGPCIMLYLMYSMPRSAPLFSGQARTLPLRNYVMGGLYVLHYLNRAVIAPLLLNPSMSPIHPIVFLAASTFNVVNSLSIGGWVAGFGNMNEEGWTARATAGLAIWVLGFVGNIWHDEHLRELRRESAREQEEKQAKRGENVNVNKVYRIPTAGLFRFVFYPHYLLEWVEWTGFWVLGGWACIPARIFLVNEITTMLPRALTGLKWYEDKFGQDKLGGRKAVIPGVI